MRRDGTMPFKQSTLILPFLARKIIRRYEFAAMVDQAEIWQLTLFLFRN
jgi:hypothetical protein